MSETLLELRNTVLRAITENSISSPTGQGILNNIETIIEQYSKLSDSDKKAYIERMEGSFKETIKSLNSTNSTEKAGSLPYLSCLVLLIIFCKLDSKFLIIYKQCFIIISFFPALFGYKLYQTLVGRQNKKLEKQKAKQEKKNKKKN